MKVYCVFTCDAWKSQSSMNLCTVCTSASALRRVLLDGIRNEVFDFGDDSATFAKNAKKFAAAWHQNQVGNSIPWDVVNNVKYAFVEEAITNSNPF